MAFGCQIYFIETDDGIEVGGTTEDEIAVDEFWFEGGIGGSRDNNRDIDIGGDDAFLFVMTTAAFTFGTSEFCTAWLYR